MSHSHCQPEQSAVDVFARHIGLRRSTDATGPGRSTYVFDVASQLKYAPTGWSRTTFIYDPTGNQQIEIPAAGNRTTTTWNYENQPTLYRLPSVGRVTMQYNGDNRRIETQEP